MTPLLADGLAILATLAAVTTLIAWLAAGRIIRRVRPDPTLLPDALGVHFRHVTLHTRDGLALSGRLSGEDGPRPTVVICAGLFGSMDGDTALVPPLVNAGFNVLQFDWRAHGMSAGQHTTLGLREVDDLLGAVDFLQARGVRRIGVLGLSMGGAVALRAAARDPRIACGVADSPYVHLTDALEGVLKERIGLRLRPLVWLILRFAQLRLGNLPLAETSPLPAVEGVGPVLYIFGTDDPLVPASDREAMYNKSGGPKSLWLVEGAGHRGAHAQRSASYHQRVVAFFEEHVEV
ncbi:MAG: alpha/beta hydrolase [Anaerolineae bacterium]